MLEQLSEAIRDAIWDLPEWFDWGHESGMGADGTPTSNIDKVAEEVIIRFVEENELQVNILSEEAGYLDRKMERTLVVDPIDGTHNAVMGLPFYSVSLAAGTRSLVDIEEGIVRNLTNDDIFYARKGEGASLNGSKIQVRKYHHRSATFLVYMGRHMNPTSLQVIKKSMRARALGCASLEMCMLAEGRADLQYMNTEVYEKSIRVVDIAASALILREAGGEIYTLQREKLDMPFNLEFRSNFIAVGDQQALEVIF